MIDYRHGESPAAFADLIDGSVDAVVTDPPYGMQDKRDGYGRRDYGGKTGRMIANDRDLSAFVASAPEIARVLKSDAWCAVWRAAQAAGEIDRIMTAAGFTLRGEVVWDKGNLGLGYQIRYRHETCSLYARGEPYKAPEPLGSVIAAHRQGGHAGRVRGGHPHRKPVDVLRRIVAFCCPPDGIVLDPFAGSGSCAIACIAEGRSYVGIECDERWWTDAERRIAEARGKTHHASPQPILPLTTDGAA